MSDFFDAEEEPEESIQVDLLEIHVCKAVSFPGVPMSAI
jgi:hypothetical protein